MELETLQKILETKKRGQYLTITYQKVLGDYVKTTTTTIRLVDYNNVKEVKEMKALKGNNGGNGNDAPKKPSNDKYLGNNIIFNVNTQKTRLQVFLTKHHTPKCVYTYQGKEIDKETWYAESGDKQATPKIMFSINIENIISIK